MTHSLATSNSGLYAALKRWRLKRDMPDDLRGRAMAVSFGLHGVWYVARGQSGWLLESGEWAPFHQAHIIGVGTVVGPRDIEGAAHRPWADAWRQSMQDSICERLNLQPS